MEAHLVAGGSDSVCQGGWCNLAIQVKFDVVGLTEYCMIQGAIKPSADINIQEGELTIFSVSMVS
jgi:hypothetical protein